MNTIEISNILHRNKYTRDYFRGVHSSNTIVPHNTFPYGIIVNTDKAGERGTHWVAIYVHNNDSAEYFDSFGQRPNIEIEKFINNFKHVKMNNIKIQSSFDTSCGPHVIYYMIQKCRGKSLAAIIKELNTPYSDSLVKLFVYELLKL
jgi:hypothetical protein